MSTFIYNIAESTIATNKGVNLADKGMTLAIVLLVAGLLVGGGIGYFAAPTKTVTVQGAARRSSRPLP